LALFDLVLVAAVIKLYSYQQGFGSSSGKYACEHLDLYYFC